jgi:indolepyruvate ferredoxin oxidoreductase alpha subunit
MTGHQPHPGVDLGHLELDRNPISIERAVKGLGVEKVITVNPFKYRKTVEALRELDRHRGVSVLIARASCPLYDRTLPNYRKKRPFRVNSAKCRNHQACLGKVACPAFFVSDGKVGIDPDRCTGCALCVQICPENAILPVKGKGDVQ